MSSMSDFSAALMGGMGGLGAIEFDGAVDGAWLAVLVSGIALLVGSSGWVIVVELDFVEVDF